ncbi:MAG TPA: VOC family protein [Lichenihabitans sp.]|nr:VOC family protein [Lichenihabitans sp.]
MPDPSFIILYVDAPPKSAAFYAGLLGAPVLENSATFAMLPLRPGVMLGLWSRHTVEPAATAGGGGAEIGFTVVNPAAVDTTYADWAGRGLDILQTPVDMDFGRTFVALDPDGHRLRVFAPAG